MRQGAPHLSLSVCKIFLLLKRQLPGGRNGGPLARACACKEGTVGGPGDPQGPPLLLSELGGPPGCQRPSSRPRLRGPWARRARECC